MLGLTIIPDEKVLNLKQKVLEYSDVDVLDGHVFVLQKFVEQYNIDIPNYKQETSYGLSTILASMGYSNIHFENKLALIYLPYTLSNNQVEYFKNSFNKLRKFDIKIASVNKDGELDLFEEDDYSQNMSTKLMKLVKKKAQTRKYLESEEIKENRQAM